MPLFKGEIAGAIGRDNEGPVEAKSVENLVADELAHTLVAQLAQRRGADMTQEVIQGFVDGQRALLGFGQLVGIGQHAEFQVAELEIQVAAAAQFEAEEPQAPPEQEARFVGDHGLEASVGEIIRPAIQTGPEVVDGFKEYFS
jgi:hypothetical protein